MMKTRTPDIASDAAIEAFFEYLDLTVEVVDRCPDAACELCGNVFDRAA